MSGAAETGEVIARFSRGQAGVRFLPVDDDFGPSRAPDLRTIRASSLAGKKAPARAWLVRDMIPDRTVTMVSGDGGVGKSLLLLQLGVAVASASDWIGLLPEPGPVLYLSAEDDEDEINRRLEGIIAAGTLSFTDLDEFHLVPLAGKDAVLAMPDRRSEIIAPTPLWTAVKDKVQAVAPRLVILDNLADVFAGNENSRPQARQFIGLLRGLAIEHHLAVLLIAHPSLTGLSSGTGTSGSTAWNNSVRSRLYLDRAKAEDGDEPDQDIRVLRVMKANYAATGAEVRMRWKDGRFKLDGASMSTFDRAASEQKADQVFLELLGAFQSQGRDVSPNPSKTFAPTLFAGHARAKGITRKAFHQAMDRLFDSKAIKIDKIGPPSKRRSRIIAG